jgi:hypothetical protein
MGRAWAIYDSIQPIRPQFFKGVRSKSTTQDRHFEPPIKTMKLFISGAVTGNGDEFWLRPELATSKEPLGGRNWWEY